MNAILNQTAVNAITSISGQQHASMTSLEIAQLVRNRHDDVKRSIERLVSRGVIAQPPMADVQELGGNNRVYITRVYVFSGEKGKRDSFVVVAQLSPEFTGAVVDRWQALESRAQVPALPDFTNPAIAARAWADAIEQQQIVQQQLESAKPAIAFVDRYVDSRGLMTFREVCKTLQVKENVFRQFLKDQKIMYVLNGNWVPHQNHIDAGRFSVKTGTSEVSGHAYTAARFTPKGVEWVAGEWAKQQIKGGHYE